MNPIGNVGIPAIIPGQYPSAADPAQGTTPFKDFLLDSIHQVNSMQQEADLAVEKLVTGGDVTAAEVLTAVQKADLAFRLMIQVRNKMVEAYEQIQSIRV
jgi:flagellar hook-basal body complex protein FliE